MMNEKSFSKRHATISLQQIDGAPVFDTTGKKVGVIDDLVINLDMGEIITAQIRVGGLLGLGGARYSVSWSQLKYLPGSVGFEVPLDDAKLAWIHLSEDIE